MKKTAILLASLLFCGCLNIGFGLQSIEVSSDYLMSIELFPDDHRIEGSLKVDLSNISSKEITGSIHPDLVIDYIKDENGNEIEYERDIELTDLLGLENRSIRIGSITLYPEDSKTLDIHFHGNPYDDILEKDCVGKSMNFMIGAGTNNILHIFFPWCNPVFSITVPKDFKILKLFEIPAEIKKEDSGDVGYSKYIGGEEPIVHLHYDKATYTFKTNDTYGFSFVCSDYVSSIEVKDGIEYKVYLFPEHENMLESTMNLTQELIEFYSDKYYPYSLDEFRVVEAEKGGTNYANDRYSTSIIMLNYVDVFVDYSGVEPDESVRDYMDEVAVVVHEPSHFWFGGLVSSEELNEAFAVFSEFLFTESFDPDL